MLHGRAYVVPFGPTAITVACDLVELTVADDKPIAIAAISLVQTTDFGDAADEVLAWSIVRGNTTSGSGGSAPTPAPLNPNSGACATTAEIMNTTVASAGTGVTVAQGGWNVRGPYDYIWVPGTNPEASQGNTLIRLTLTVPADSLTVGGQLIFWEF